MQLPVCMGVRRSASEGFILKAVFNTQNGTKVSHVHLHNYDHDTESSRVLWCGCERQHEKQFCGFVNVTDFFQVAKLFVLY